MDEIAKKTDFRMTYSTRREGRKVKYFTLELDISNVSADKFNIKADYVQKLPVAAPFADVLAELVLQGFSNKSAKEIMESVKDDVELGLRLEYALKILSEYNRKKPIQNKLGFLRNAILEDWRKNDVKSRNAMNISKASKVKNQMQLNSLAAEKEKYQQHIADANAAIQKTGISLTDLRSNEVPIPSSMVDIISQDILRNDNTASEGIRSILKAFNFGVERFKQVYMTKYMLENKNASVDKISGFNSLESFMPAFVS